MIKIHKKKKGGFSLIELTIVLTISGFLLAGSLSLSKNVIDVSKQRETKLTLQQVENAIKSYAVVHGRLPCPAGIYLSSSDAEFGKEKRSITGECVSSAEDGIRSTVSNSIFVGAVPVITLGLAAVDAKDAWNSRLVYVVNSGYANNLLTNNLEDSGALISVKNGNSSFTNAIFAIISNGKNKKGAIGVSGKEFSLNNASDTEKANSYKNINGALQSGDNSNVFDDLIAFSSKSRLLMDTQLYDGGCFLDTMENSVLSANCWGMMNTEITSLVYSNYLNYRNRIIKQKVPTDPKSDVCVVECGSYGRLIIYKITPLE